MSSTQAATLEGWLQDPTLSALSGRFHSHITVQGAPAALRSFCQGRAMKATIIELEDFSGRQQQDVMTTAYHRGDVATVGAQLLKTVHALEAAGFPVLRVKLEHESLPTLEPFTDQRYREVHIKLSIPEADYPAQMAWLASAAEQWGYVPSRNPYQRRAGRVVQFLNLRIYTGSHSTVQQQTAALAEMLRARGLDIIEIKAETAVIDTAHALDAWWA